VLQDLDRRRTDTNGIGYTARQTIRFIDQLQVEASPDARRDGIPMRGGHGRFHGGELDLTLVWPGFTPGYADDVISGLAAISPTELLVLERTDQVAKIYRVAAGSSISSSRHR
jgi:predicted ribonuclease YlaK